MVKLARELIERLYLLCRYMEGHELNAFDLQDEGLRIKTPSVHPNIRSVCQQLHEHGFGDSYLRWRQLMEPIEQALMGAEGGTAHHPSLIDMMVEVLESPYARQALTGHALRDLRRAILLPEEMSKVGDALRKESGCASCGRPFHSGELATAAAVNDSIAFYCVFCMYPERTPCASEKCQNASEDLHKMLSALAEKTRKVRCPEHDPNYKPAAQVQSILVDQGPAPEIVSTQTQTFVVAPQPWPIVAPETWRELRTTIGNIPTVDPQAAPRQRDR